MNKIKIGFSTRNMWLSKIIRFITRSKVSHTWLLYYDDDFGCDMVMEASFEGFRIMPYEMFKRKNIIVAVFEPKYSLAKGFKDAGLKLGTSYDVFGLFGAIVPLIGKWFKRTWHNPFKNDKGLFCSDVLVDIMKNSSYPGSEDFLPKDSNPEFLEEFFQKEQKL